MIQEVEGIAEVDVVVVAAHLEEDVVHQEVVEELEPEVELRPLSYVFS